MSTHNYAGIVTDLAMDLLVSWMTAGEPTPDPGPAVLALLLPERHRALTEAVLSVWLRGLRDAPTHAGLHNAGLAARLAAYRLAAARFPRLSRLATATERAFIRFADSGGWPPNPVIQPGDYDLISGPAGVLLAHCVSTPRPDQLAPLATHLAKLCRDPALAQLRTAIERQPPAGHEHGVNTGLSHGAAGVAAALAAAHRADPTRADITAALSNILNWFSNQAYLDRRGILSWSRSGRTGRVAEPPTHRRQGWCYGTPGIAWALHEASTASPPTAAQNDDHAQLARRAMGSLCHYYDEDFHLVGNTATSRLAICHGVAGALAIADAFTTHTDLTEAAALRDRLTEYLIDRIDTITELGRTDMRLLTGAPGIAATLLTTAGAPRTWLPIIALR